MTPAPSDMSVTPDSREPRSNPRQPIFRDHNLLLLPPCEERLMADLLPCPTPFCAVPEPYIERFLGATYRVRCKYCGVCTETFHHESAAVEQWNTRSATPSPDRTERTWFILREPKFVPELKGPFPHSETKSFLREVMEHRPTAHITVLRFDSNGRPYVSDGPETLMMLDMRCRSTALKHIDNCAAALAAMPEASDLEGK